MNNHCTENPEWGPGRENRGLILARSLPGYFSPAIPLPGSSSLVLFVPPARLPTSSPAPARLPARNFHPAPFFRSSLTPCPTTCQTFAPCQSPCKNDPPSRSRQIPKLATVLYHVQHLFSFRLHEQCRQIYFAIPAAASNCCHCSAPHPTFHAHNRNPLSNPHPLSDDATVSHCW